MHALHLYCANRGSNRNTGRDPSIAHIEEYGIILGVISEDTRRGNTRVLECSIPLYWYYHVGDHRKKGRENVVPDMHGYKPSLWGGAVMVVAIVNSGAQSPRGLVV